MDFLKSKIKLIIDFSERITNDKVSVYAAQASFFILISSIPLLALIMGFVKYLIPFTRLEILDILPGFLPKEVYGFSAGIINELFSKTSGSIISITAITMLWSASRGFLALIQGLNSVFNAPEYGWIAGRITAFLYTFLFALALVATLFALVISNTFIDLIPFNCHIPILLLLLTLAFSAFYTFLPRRRTKFLRQVPGGFLSAASWIVFSWIFAAYIDNFSNFSYIYGSLAAIVLLMLWLYFCIMIFLWGAEFNQLLIERRKK